MADLVPVGVGTAGIAAFDRATGKVYVSSYEPSTGLHGVNWQLFADSFGKAWGPIAEGLKNKLSGPAYAGQRGYADVSPYPPSAGGAYLGAGGGGLFGGADTSTILMIGVVALAAFMFVKK